MPCEERRLERILKAEARALADCEPMLASFLSHLRYKHENLGSALRAAANKLQLRPSCPYRYP